jgi:hypothetical protein
MTIPSSRPAFRQSAARSSFRNFSAEIVRRDAALKTLCILENSRGFAERG